MSRCKLEEFISYEQPTKYIVDSDQYDDSYEIPVLTAGKSFILGYTDEKNNIFNDLPVIIFDDFTTSVQFVDFPFKVKSSAMKLLKNTEQADVKYCYYLLKFLQHTPENHKRQWLSATSQNTVELPIIEEQKNIVKKLDKILEVIDNQNKQLELLDEAIKARFVELFGGNDKKVAISSLCDVLGGYSFKSEDISSKGFIKILQIGNVYLGDVNWETTNYLPKEFDNIYSRFLLNEGDIVIALTRPIIQSLGNVKACIVKASDTPCLLNQRVGRIVSKKNVDVDLKFIYGCLMTDDFTRYVESCCTGCSQPNISTKDIENYMIPDASYEKQMDFVRFKEQVDKSKFLSNHSLLLLKSITF